MGQYKMYSDNYKTIYEDNEEKSKLRNGLNPLVAKIEEMKGKFYPRKSFRVNHEEKR